MARPRLPLLLTAAALCTLAAAERHRLRRLHPSPSIPVDLYIDRALALYTDTLAQRAHRLTTLYGGDLDAVVPWNGAGHAETYLWDVFPPAFNCPFKHRLGRLSDGGKVVCNWETLRARCVGDPNAAIIYSFGVRGDISFEVDLAERTGCGIHAFDHTVVGLPQETHNVVLTQAGLAAIDAPPTLYSLPTLMAQRGHNRIHLLKVDCEACEWTVFAELARRGALSAIDQLLIELHFKQATTNAAGPDSGVHDVFGLFEALESAGLYPFSWEVNHNAGATRIFPWVIEYSFVRARSEFMRARSEFMRDVGAWERVAREGEGGR